MRARSKVWGLFDGTSCIRILSAPPPGLDGRGDHIPSDTDPDPDQAISIIESIDRVYAWTWWTRANPTKWEV